MATGAQQLEEESIQTVAPEAPITYLRNVNNAQNGAIAHPSIARATEAVDATHPHGTSGYKNIDKNDGYTVLQQHVAFFDRNNDGIVYPYETFLGFHALGFNIIVSFIAMILLHTVFSYPTLDSTRKLITSFFLHARSKSWIPSPAFPIHIINIHRAKHGSDSEVYDTEGRFVPYKFEELFSKYSKTGKGLTFEELFKFIKASRNAYDLFGWGSMGMEWGVTFWLLKDKEGFLSKEAMRGMYDGSVFYYTEEQVKLQKLQKKGKSS